MLRKLCRLRKNQEGATAIEFAMVAPVLFMMIFGVIDCGLLLTTQSALEGATSSAAREYKALSRSTNATGASAGTIRNMVIQYGGGLVEAGRTRVVMQRLNSGFGNAGMPDGESVTGSAGQTWSNGDVVQYRVYYDFKVFTPFLAGVIGDERGMVPLMASTVVQNEPTIGAGGGL
jgi:Flp pilus assembly protein TadG